MRFLASTLALASAASAIGIGGVIAEIEGAIGLGSTGSDSTSADLSTSQMADTTPNTCTTPAERPEWRSLSNETQTAYIDAVMCLFTKPSRIGLSTSLYEDFPYIHSKLNLQIHFVAQFLVWHRVFVKIYEGALRNDCGYTGPMPYWDWSLDSGSLPESEVVLDWGGDGIGFWTPPSRPDPLTSCVTSGPLAAANLTYYDGNVRPHCLNRAFNNGTGSPESAAWGASQYSPAFIANITDTSDDFATFYDRVENGPHGAIHQAIGGDMVPSTSPNDALFMLHHCQVDRLWWNWQQKGQPRRNSDFGGKRFDGSNATLQDIMPFLGLGPNVTIESAMTTQNDMLCYIYV